MLQAPARGTSEGAFRSFRSARTSYRGSKEYYSGLDNPRWVFASETGLIKADRVHPKRERLQRKFLAGCLVITTLGIRRNDTSTSHWDQERQAYFGVIDPYTSEDAIMRVRAEKVC